MSRRAAAWQARLGERVLLKTGLGCLPGDRDRPVWELPCRDQLVHHAQRVRGTCSPKSSPAENRVPGPVSTTGDFA